jgi:antitoxin component YwqK of YwqJK toxin-antitoxin module
VVTERGQAHTLEGLVAALLLLSAVVYALQVTAVTPLSASTSSQHIENQQEATARGVLATAAANDSLSKAIRYRNLSHPDYEYHDADRAGYYTTGAPPNPFGKLFERAFDSNGIAYNVYVTYHDGDSIESEEMVYQGVPSDNAVRATRSVVLLETDPFVDEDWAPTGTTLADETDFQIPNEGSSAVYNVVRVEVVVWRI